MKYGDKIIYMEGVIVEIHDGCVGIDLKGRLGYLKIPMRMLITDYPLVVGQSRICMFYLRKAHIGEVQSSIWPDDVLEEAASRGVYLL